MKTPSNPLPSDDGGGCPSAGRLAQVLRDGDAGPDIDAHLETCETCRRKLEELAGSTPLIADDMADTLVAAPTELREVIESLQSESNPAEPTFEFLTPSSQPGYVGSLGPYNIIEVVGRGGMGVVLKAHDPSLDRIVAIKVLAPALASRATARRRFVREARAAAAVSHEHVVTIHSVDEANALPFLVMQFVSGRSLEKRVHDTGPLKLEEILRIGMQAASGLAAAHAQGLVHRDVKPGNIMLENGVERVKITDFGIARAADDTGVTVTGEVTGTPDYMSPEQARGERVDARSDLFALGGVLYFMCTGRAPFTGSTALSTLKKVCEDSPTRVSEINPDVPHWLEDLVGRMLEKDPARRPATARDIAEELRTRLAELQRGEAPPEPRHPPAPPAVKRPRHRAAYALAAVLLAGLIAGVMWANRRNAITGTTQSSSQNTPPPTAAATSGAGDFAVGSGDRVRRYTTLEAAVASAAAGDTVEIHRSGRIPVARMDLGSRPLLIRAAPRATPVLTRSDARPAIITTTAPLALEGLTLEGTVVPPAAGATPPAADMNECLIFAGGPLLATHCRLAVKSAAETHNACIRLIGPGETELRNCEIYAPQGMGVDWHAPRNAGSTVSFQDCIVAGGMAVVAHPEIAQARLEVNRCTFLAGNVVGLMPGDVPRGWTFTVNGSVLASRRVLRDMTPALGARRLKEIAWSDSQSLFDNRAENWDVSDRDANEDFSPAHGVGSYDCNVRFASSFAPRLQRGEMPSPAEFELRFARLPTGQALPQRRVAQFGARTASVGPGAPYDAFRASSTYPAWRERVGSRLGKAPATQQSATQSENR